MRPGGAWPERVVVVGAGAIGLTVGARLLRNGTHVEFVARPDQAEAMASSGIELHSPTGVERTDAIVHASPRSAKLTDGDLAIIAVKLPDSPAALDDLLQASSSNITIACMQNGVEGGRMALRRFNSVLGVLVLLRCQMLSPGTVYVFQDPPGILDAGAWAPNAPLHLHAVRLCELLSAAGFSSHAVPDIVRWKYAKLIRNMENGIEVLVGKPGRIPPSVLAAAQREAETCLRAAGFDWVDDAEWSARCNVIAPEVHVEGVSRSGSSMLQSIHRQRRTEMAYLNGEVVMLGRLHGVPTPVNERIRAAVTQVERRPHDSDLRAALLADVMKRC